MNPINPVVWIVWLASVIALTLVWGLSGYPLYGTVEWRLSVEFAIRNILSESFQSFKRVKNEYLSQKIILVIFLWSCFLLVKSYAGNLTAMITRPKLVMKFTELEDFFNQNEMSLVIMDGDSAIDYMSQSPADSLMYKLLEQTKKISRKDDMASMCFTMSTQFTKKHASICDHMSILSLLSDDFSKSGKCNWYTIKNRFNHGTYAMAFQVNFLRKIVNGNN